MKILLDEAVVTPEQLAQAREEQRKSGSSLEAALEKLGIGESKIISILSEKFRVPAVNWATVHIDPEALEVVPEEKARKYLVFPLSIERMERRQGKITLAMVDPSDLATINEIAFMTSCSVKPMMASEPAILNAIRQYYKTEEAGGPGGATAQEGGWTKAEEKKPGGPVVVGGKSGASPAPPPLKGLDELHALAKDLIASVEYLEEREEIIPAGPENQADKWLTSTLTQALKRGAGTVHLDSHEKGLTARYWVDGILYNFGEAPAGLKKAVISALKQRGQITAPTDRIPYQGDLTLKLDSKEKVEFLVFIYPTFYGEKITLKLKHKAAHLPDVTQLGFEEGALKMFLKLLDVPDGLILITSPTGGGKTTTFYTVLQYLNKPHLNILTLENAITCSLPGINQSYLENPDAIREKAFQLMDYNPDMFGIGEILNGEGARTALDLSSETLVLATLAAPDTSAALLQFLSLVETPSQSSLGKGRGQEASRGGHTGASPMGDQREDVPGEGAHPGVLTLLALDSVNCITSQRLVRQICPTCKEELKPSFETLDLLIRIGLPEKETGTLSLYKGKGCADCNQTGYRGLTGLFEIMRITREIRALVLAEPLAGSLRKNLRDLKMMTLERSGLQKIKNGITSVEEVKRVLAL